MSGEMLRERSGHPVIGWLATAACAGLLIGTTGLGPSPRAASAPETLDAARRRPLFAPTRRPPPELSAEPAVPIQPAVSDTSPKFELRGIIVGDRRRVAILRRPASPQPIDVTVGSQIDGWTVTEIRPRGIVLRRDTRVVTVAMPEPGR